MRYKGVETSVPLLLAYEALALAHKKAPNTRGWRDRLQKFGTDEEKFSVPEEATSKDFANYDQSFALLIINASIVEGTLRTILSEKVGAEIEALTERGISEGKTKPSKPEQLLEKFRLDVELQGGWEKLKEQYLIYLDLSLDNALSEPVREGINALFVLRNVLAHGTALIHPVTQMDESMKDLYPYNWQRRLQRARVYLKKIFGHDEIFDNLAEFDLPRHFMDLSKKAFRELEASLDGIPPRAVRTIGLIDGYQFGFKCYSE